VETETDYAAEIPDSGVALTGRIDRRSVQGEESAVVDYKTGGLPRKADTAPPGEEPPIVQLPVYVHLLEQAGREVSSASYYSVKENRFRHVYTERAEHGKGWMSREYLDDAIASIRHTAVRCAQLINAGDLRVPEECEPCDYRGLCRAVFRIAGSPARAPGSPADSGGGGRDVQGRETQGRGAQERNTRGKNDKEGRRGDA
jgi:RecB family exonuclease